jgi:hypothetical protein
VRQSVSFDSLGPPLSELVCTCQIIIFTHFLKQIISIQSPLHCTRRGILETSFKVRNKLRGLARAVAVTKVVETDRIVNHGHLYHEKRLDTTVQKPTKYYNVFYTFIHLKRVFMSCFMKAQDCIARHEQEIYQLYLLESMWGYLSVSSLYPLIDADIYQLTNLVAKLIFHFLD